MKITMTRLYNANATYIAYGQPQKVGSDSAWTPGLGGSVFHSRSSSATLGKIGPGGLPRWLQRRIDAGEILPTHFDVFGHGKGSISAHELFTVEGVL